MVQRHFHIGTQTTKSSGGRRSSARISGAIPTDGGEKPSEKSSQELLGPEIPQKIRAKIEEWHAAKLKKALPFFHSIRRSINVSRSGRKASFWSETGERLEVRRYALPENGKWIDVVAGQSLEPAVVRNEEHPYGRQTTADLHWYSIWAGLDNWERRPPTIRKTFGEKNPGPLKATDDTSRARMTQSSRKGLKRTPGLLLEGDSSQKPAKRARTANESHNTDAIQLSTPTQIEEPRATGPGPSEPGPSGPNIIPPVEATATAPTTDSHMEDSEPDEFDLEMYIQDHVFLEFHTPDHNKVRRKFFSFCDSVQKLFAQAAAGNLFGQIATARTLVADIPCHDGMSPTIFDRDEDDFTGFVNAIKAASWWKVENGKMLGECIIKITVLY